MSPPRPRWLMAGSRVRSLRPALCSSTAAGTLPLPEGKVMHHAKVRERAPRAAENCWVHRNTAPTHRKVVAHRSVYIHMMSSQGETQKFPGFPYTVC